MSAIEAASAAAKTFKEVDAAACHVKNLPTSTKKLNELVRTVRGLPVGEAISRMTFSQRRMAVAVGKVWGGGGGRLVWVEIAMLMMLMLRLMYADAC